MASSGATADSIAIVVRVARASTAADASGFRSSGCPTFQATPLPPVPGEPVAFVLQGSAIGLVEIYQGNERVHVVVNPFDRAPASFNAFRAKSADVPRALGYGQGEARLEVEASPLLGRAIPEEPADAGPDAPTDRFESDTCPASTEVAADAGGVCGGPGGLMVTLRVRNLRNNPVRVERTAQPPNSCSWEVLGPVGVGKTASFVVFDQSVVRLVDVQGNAAVRQVKLTLGGACDLVVR